ncbi:Gfo/Idh/MocA family protein [Microbacterium excoecariae]|uniref:Gfo/Idh/MocA family protein n=1 Tax=Microbacterium excoecariae TaxID=2715210 RepID=UPI0014084526|nr:Gfo/Idh/MocA family oxidoreductase [Microbacterium excoecariae]NHI16282.1 Gfo/Idh/MocA family oxidoreductase [Microbacterium excoecariae]
MSHTPLGIAVIGAGMAGKAHANAYRQATAVYAPTLPEVRLVSICDLNGEVAADAAARFGYERHDTDWRQIVADPSIHVVSVVVANFLHREIVEALLAAGKHVLCEKPLSDTIEDAEAMAEAARNASTVARIGLTFRRSPGIAFIRDLVQTGRLGDVLHFSGRYWADYGAHPDAPMSWRYQGPAGSGALADIGSHLSYVAEFVCGDIRSVSGARLTTAITERPKPLGAVVGHTRGAVSTETAPVENDDYAGFTAEFENGSGTLEVSRVAVAHPTSMFFEVFGTKGAARWDQRNFAQVEVAFHDDPADVIGYRTVQMGPTHPYVAGGLPIDAPGAGHGQNDQFVFQARAFLDEVVGAPESASLPRCASFEEGVRNMRLLDAVVRSHAADGAAVDVPAL